MKALHFVIALCFSAALVAGAFADTTNAVAKSGKKITLEQILNEKVGGRLVRPGTGTGATGFINVGGAMDRSEIERVVATISKMLTHRQKIEEIKSLDGLPSRDIVDRFGLNVGVFIVSDAKLPPMLVAPEERWALANVARLGAGLKDDPAGKAIYRVRCRGELQRAFCYAAGCGSSQYDNNLMNVSSVDKIETVKPDVMVFDAIQRCNKYLATIGVTQPVLVPYVNACQQGWAPAPTNDVQRKIWDKVHAIPSKPIKIEYNEKRDKGK